MWAFPHPGHVAPPLRPWYFVLITIHVLRFASQHHPVNASHASMSQDFASLPHPGLKTCISPPSRSCPTCIQVARFASRLPACCISPLYRSLLNSINVPIFSSHLHPCWISPPSGSQELCFHPGPIPPISRSPDVSHLHLGPVSLPSRSRYSRLTSIQVTSQLPSRSRQLHISSIQVPSHYQPRPDNHVSSPARSRYSCLTIQFTSNPHLHSAKCISVSSRSHLIPSRPQGLCLTSIKAPSHSHPYRKICISPASRFHLNCIQVPRFASHLHLCHVSPPVSSPGFQLTCIQVPSYSIQVPNFVSHLHPVHASSPSRSRYSCHISIQVTFCLHPGPDPGPKNGISAPSKSHLNSPRTRDFCLASIQVPLHLNSGPRIHVSFSSPSMSRLTSMHKGPKIHASPLSRSRLTSSTFSTSFVTHLHPGCVSPPFRTWFRCIKVPICTHPLHWCCVSHPSRSWEEHLNSIQITLLTHLGLQICISPPSRSRLTSVQIPIFVSHLQTGRISPPFRSWRLHLSFIQVPYHPHPCLEICVSTLSISCLISIQVTRTASLLHPGPASPPSRPLDSYFTSNLLCPGLKNFTSSPSSSHLSPIHISKCTSSLHSGLISPLSRSEDSCLASIQVSLSRLCRTSM